MKNRIRVKRVVRRRVLEVNLVEPNLQLLCQQHGQGGIDTLSHLDHWNNKRYLALPIDADEGVLRKCRRGCRCRGRGPCNKRQRETDRQAPAEQGAGSKEAPTVEPRRKQTLGHSHASLPAAR